MALRKQASNRILMRLGVSDAREVLNAKGLKNQNSTSTVIRSGRVSKPQRQQQQQQPFNKFLLKKTVTNDLAFARKPPRNQHMQGKQVQLKGGLITITSKLNAPRKGGSPIKDDKQRLSNRFDSSAKKFTPVPGKKLNKQIRVNSGGISVTTVNNLARERGNVNMSEDEEEDDLEKMTLDDLPDLKKTKTLSPVYRVSQVQKAPTPSLSSRLQERLDNPVRNSASQELSSGALSASYGASTLISNLHPRVSEDDLKELFDDIGPTESAKLLSPGTALVTFYRKNDAISACSAYHGRLLDGQPMHCTLLSSMSSPPKSITSVTSF